MNRNMGMENKIYSIINSSKFVFLNIYFVIQKWLIGIRVNFSLLEFFQLK